ncbi:MAG: type II toxin-antitoxin system VapB family antitoxin [Actinomycetota bacterium]|nr:type II toxin-antitoxin system VapB family antitoxin [Actinomycetota bacterium]
MAFNIKNDETQRLARELAEVTGENITQAITVAVSERLDRVRADAGVQHQRTAARLRRIGADAASRWIEPLRSSDHGDLLYDEKGLPR